MVVSSSPIECARAAAAFCYGSLCILLQIYRLRSSAAVTCPASISYKEECSMPILHTKAPDFANRWVFETILTY